MKRNYLRVGDCSTSGGRVVDGIASMTCDGIELTYVGAGVSCPRVPPDRHHRRRGAALGG